MNCVVVFGRQPAAGKVKTRLAADLGEETAAEVYRLLLRETLDCAVACGARVVLSLAEPVSGGWLPPVDVEVEHQCSGDLGDRMAEAFQRRFAEGCGRAVIVGSDCPEMGTEHLVEAFEAVARSPVVVGPALDGGFWLIGQQAPGGDLFRGVEWSSPSTWAQTRARIASSGIAWHELPRLADIDSLPDLEETLASGRLRSGLAQRLRTALGPGTGRAAGVERPPR